MAPTRRNTSTPFVELPGNGLTDFNSEDVTSPVLVVVDAYPDHPHGLVAHVPPPHRHPIRRLVFAIRRATLAVLFAPFLVVAWFLLRVWWVARLSATRSWYGIVAVVTGIRDAIGHAVALVRSAFAAGVRGVGGAAAFVVESTRRVGQRVLRTLVFTLSAVVFLGSYGVRIVATTSVAFGSAVYNIARLGGAAAARLAESARTTGGQLAHAGALRGAAGLSAAASLPTRAVYALSQVTPVVRVNFAAVQARLGDVRVATPLGLGSTAALAAAVMLIGGGIALLLTPQTPGPSAPPAVAIRAVAIPLPTVAVQREPQSVALRPPAPAAAPAPAAPARRVPEAPATIEPKPAGRSTVTPARVRAIWDKTDTRSLDRAIAEMRSATLAFRRCEMRMTSSDVATATCSESASASVAWTFDFRRSDDRWLIEGVSTSEGPPVAR